MRKATVLLLTTLTAVMAQAEPEQSFKRLSNSEVIEHIRSALPKDKTPAERTRSLSMFESLDRNRDNEVSLTEMRRHPSLANSFHKLDINNDGVLNRDEIKPLQEEAKGLRNILSFTSLRVI